MTFRKHFVFLLMLISGQAFAALPAEYDLKPDETVLNTANGCKIVVPGIMPKSAYPYLSAKTWLGPCVDGWALGPGSMIENRPNGTRSSESTEFRLYGRAVGEMRTQIFGAYGEKFSEVNGYIWGDIGFIQTEKLSKGFNDIRDFQHQLMLGGPRGGTDKDVGVNFELTATSKFSTPCGPGKEMRCVARWEWDLKQQRELNREVYPCADDCAEVWREKTAEALEQMQTFIRATQPEFIAAQNRVRPAYEPFLAAAQAELERSRALAIRAAEVEKGKAEIARAAEEQRTKNLEVQQRQAQLEGIAGIFKDILVGALKVATVAYVAHEEQKSEERAAELERQRKAAEAAKQIELPAAQQPQQSSATSSQPGKSSPQIQYVNYSNASQECIELRGNTIGNRCGYDLLVTWCVTQPQQTKNFYDSSEAFDCSRGGGLNTVKAGSTEGNVMYGNIHFYACPYNDYYAPARMKTKFFPAEGLGLYRGTCVEGQPAIGGVIIWYTGGMLVSRPRE